MIETDTNYEFTGFWPKTTGYSKKLHSEKMYKMA